jgi:signal transduction histidine kinase
MNRHCRGGQQAPLAGWAGNYRVRRAECGGSLESDHSPWFDRSSPADADESEVLKIMAAGLAHDINNMLYVSVGAIELLQNRIGSKQMEEISDLSKLALFSVRRASAMAHDFLSFTQPLRVDSKCICLSATVASMAELLKCTLGDEIEIKLILAEGLSQILCSQRRLESALLNLAINARDAMPLG